MSLNMATERNNNSISFDIHTLKEFVVCEAISESKTVCFCKVNFDATIHTWTIVAWFTNESLQGHGIGKQTLAKAISKLYSLTGIPEEIKYIWNGTNSYVLEWMEKHFDAESSCPIAVQKKQADDDWESHIYNWNVEKALEYFEIKKKT